MIFIVNYTIFVMIEHCGQKQGCSAKKTDISLMPLDSNDKYTGIMLRHFELGMHSRSMHCSINLSHYKESLR